MIPTTFTEKVSCSSGGKTHEHELEIAETRGPFALRPYTSARPEGTSARPRKKCWIQYTCPQSGEYCRVQIDCRSGFKRPYRVVSVDATKPPVKPSTVLTDRDKENRAIALDLIKKSNDVVTSFAKQMATTSLSAVGVILGLAKLGGLDTSISGLSRDALITSCGLCLVAAFLFSLAPRAREISVSLDDYDEAPQQLIAIAHRREMLTQCGFAFLTLGVAVAILLLVSFRPPKVEKATELVPSREFPSKVRIGSLSAQPVSRAEPVVHLSLNQGFDPFKTPRP